ncbi:Chitin-binding protein OS=Streptomyces fumanus OX=67302 GN=GCM10018772_11230 PE=4 SV=1 [Streptomyces fumanus]
MSTAKTQTLGWGPRLRSPRPAAAPAQNITLPVQTSGYTGHHILFVIWQASHLDQAACWCSDVNFG